ncbi:MAG: peptide/nickel transport system permease protein [Thermoleophilaceae bacterium]|nr:peptide/nickel transport system permease protein [Thermoleophilaceae bacterium]
MIRYIIRRLLWGILLLFAVSAITFVIFFILPSGDPAQLRAGPRAGPDLIAAVREQLHLNDSKPEQFVRYMKGIFLHFDFGKSYQNDTSIKDDIFSRLPATISLAAGAVVLWLALAFPIGIISAIRQRSLLDRLTMGGSLVAISAPVYWLGLVALYLFADDVGKFKIFPGIDSYVPLTQDPVKWFTSLLLPWIVLAASFAAIYARLLRGNLIDTMSEDYIRTARAKGLKERRVVIRHGVRSAVTPVVTILGLDLGILLGGAILTESVFNIPGIGRYSYDAIQRLDLPKIQGTVLIAAFFIIALNLLVDIAYAFLDPRVTYG